MITENMKKFIQENKKSYVYLGEHVWNGKGIAYHLENGSVFSLMASDIESAPGFVPDWGFGRDNTKD